LKAKLEAALRERDDALEQVARADSPAGHDQLRGRRRAERTATAVLR
jgi:flagellar FliJ protein